MEKLGTTYEREVEHVGLAHELYRLSAGADVPPVARNSGVVASDHRVPPRGLMPRMTVTSFQWIVPFERGGREMRDLLGGKGANVAEMTRVLGAERVPSGFTITTEACVRYMRDGGVEPAGLAGEVAQALGELEERAGKRLGDPRDPLLVSVRSGARESMPGMMDTVLNLGLNDESVEGLAARTGNPRFAWDAYRRFVQMYSNVCRGVPGETLEAAIAERKRAAGVELDVDLSEAEPIAR